VWAHATCEGISREHFKAIKSLSSLSNFVYYCQAKYYVSRIKNIAIEWVQSHVSPQIDTVVLNIPKEHLSTEYAVTDLSAKIDNLQAQEKKLNTQFTSTSNAFGRYSSRGVVSNFRLVWQILCQHSVQSMLILGSLGASPWENLNK